MTDVECLTLAVEKDPMEALAWDALADALEESGGGRTLREARLGPAASE